MTFKIISDIFLTDKFIKIQENWEILNETVYLLKILPNGLDFFCSQGS